MTEKTKVPRWLKNSKEYSRARGVIIGVVIAGLAALLLGGFLLDRTIANYIQLRHSNIDQSEDWNEFPEYYRAYERERQEREEALQRSSVNGGFVLSGALIVYSLVLTPIIVIYKAKTLKKLREHADWYRFYRVNPINVEIGRDHFRKYGGNVVTAEARFRADTGEKVMVELKQNLSFWEAVSVDEVRKMQATVGYNGKTKQTLTYAPGEAPELDANGWPVKQ